MNFLNGLLATLGSLVLVAAGIMMVLIASEAVSPNVIPGGAFDSELADVASATGAGMWGYVGAAIALIAIGILVLVVEFLHVVRAAAPGMVLLRSEEEGIVRISLESIRQLAERTCRGNRSVRRTPLRSEDDRRGTASAMRRWPEHGRRSPWPEFGNPEGRQRSGRAPYRAAGGGSLNTSPLRQGPGTGGFSEVSECPNRY